MTTAAKQEIQTTLGQLFRYAIVGGIAFVADFGSLYILTEYVGLHYLISAGLAFALGLTVNYLLAITWVFTHSKSINRSKEFIAYGIIGITGLLLNEALIWSLTEIAGLHYTLAKIGSTGTIFLYNFFLRKYILFNDNSQ